MISTSLAAIEHCFLSTTDITISTRAAVTTHKRPSRLSLLVFTYKRSGWGWSLDRHLRFKPPTPSYTCLQAVGVHKFPFFFLPEKTGFLCVVLAVLRILSINHARLELTEIHLILPSKAGIKHLHHPCPYACTHLPVRLSRTFCHQGPTLSGAVQLCALLGAWHIVGVQ